MTRIISGGARSIALDVPDAGTRPTSDRVRESLFGALESADALDGASVLDLFAGSGALALEAVSRGAARADLVERGARAAVVARRNAERVARSLGGGVDIRVHRSAVAAFLATTSDTWDLVFVDPPYDLPETELGDVLRALTPALRRTATVVVERAARSPRPPITEPLRETRDRRYGDTRLWWFECA